MTVERRDHDLLRAALAGEPRHKRELVERLLPTVRARVTCALFRYKRGPQAEQAIDDLTQHVFLALFEDDGRRLRAWEPGRGASLTTFVGLVAEREVIGILRRGRRNPWTEAPTEADELARRVGSVPDHEAQVASRELLSVVLDRALSTLDERGLLLFQRLVVDEAGVEQVARETGASFGALYMWKSRFSKMVRDFADELEGERRVEAQRAARPSSFSLTPAWRAR